MTRATFEKGAKVKRWEKHLTDPSVALKQIGALMVSESKRAFKLQRFGRDNWPARAPVNVFGIISDFHEGKSKPPNRRFDKRPALRDTGRLSKSIAFHLVSNHVVEVGSNLPYAGVHHTGGEVESMPITERVQETLGKWLKNSGRDYKSRLGFLLSEKMTGKTLKMDVPERPIVGISQFTMANVREAVAVKIMEAQ